MGAFFTPRRRCPPDQRSLSDRRLPLPSGQPYTPLEPPTCGAADNGAYEDSLSFTRPAFPSPVTPGWSGSPSAFPWASHPAVTRDARQDRDGPHGHWTGSHPRHQLPPNSAITQCVRPHVARLPPAPPPCCDRISGEGLSPPLEPQRL